MLFPRMPLLGEDGNRRDGGKKDFVKKQSLDLVRLPDFHVSRLLRKVSPDRP